MLHAVRSILVIFASMLPLAATLADDVTPPEKAETTTRQPPPSPADLTLDPQQFDLAAVSDRTPLAFEESAAYYRILDHVRTVDPDALRQQAQALQQQRWEDSPRFRQFPLEDYPLFYDLTQSPDEYRGQPVHMRGHLIRLVKYAAGPNDYGIETLYEGWLVTPDAETHPTTVVCTEIPEGMPIGEELIDGVSACGYFFKLHTYSSRDRKIRFAPMVLAHRLQHAPVAAGTGWPVSPTTMIISVLAAAALAVVIAWITARRSAAAKQKRFADAVPESPPEFLNDLTP